jgi:hypothetical protein
MYRTRTHCDIYRSEVIEMLKMNAYLLQVSVLVEIETSSYRLFGR